MAQPPPTRAEAECQAPTEGVEATCNRAAVCLEAEGFDFHAQVFVAFDHGSKPRFHLNRVSRSAVPLRYDSNLQLSALLGYDESARCEQPVIRVLRKKGEAVNLNRQGPRHDPSGPN